MTDATNISSAKSNVTKLGADERLRRLLSAVPWIAEEEGPTVEEVCNRFGYNESDLASDLNLLFVCGVYPFTPDSLMEAEIAEGRVWIRYADYFARPLRLTPAEGLAVLSAGRALLSLPGNDDDGALGRALNKLAAALGVDPEETIEIDLGQADPTVLEMMKKSVAEQRRLAFDYYSYGRDEWNRRDVEPNDVYASAGEWYLSAFDREKNAERLFRLDRMRNPELSDEQFLANAERGRVTYERSEADPIVSIDVDKDNWWVSEYYPTEGVEELDENNKRVHLSISGPAFLERLLLRLGSHVKTSGAGDVARDAANRVLAQYK